jgi:hypothetical protein
MLASPGDVVVISELPAVGKAGGQFLENLVRLRSKVVIDGTALPRKSHDQELCPAHDDRSSKPEMTSFAASAGVERLFVGWSRPPEWETVRATVGQEPAWGH